MLQLHWALLLQRDVFIYYIFAVVHGKAHRGNFITHSLASCGATILWLVASKELLLYLFVSFNFRAYHFVFLRNDMDIIISCFLIGGIRRNFARLRVSFLPMCMHG